MNMSPWMYKIFSISDEAFLWSIIKFAYAFVPCDLRKERTSKAKGRESKEFELELELELEMELKSEVWLPRV